MRLSLTGKFVLGSLAVAGATSVLPILVSLLGIDFWSGGMRFFVALGVGGVIGFFLSRMFHAKFDALRGVTERIREGDLRVEIQTAAGPRLADEVDDLAEISANPGTSTAGRCGRSVAITRRVPDRRPEPDRSWERTGREGAAALSPRRQAASPPG